MTSNSNHPSVSSARLSSTHELDVSLALGHLIQLIGLIPQNPNRLPEMPFSELKAWFQDRFDIKEETCSGKAFGDALAFAIRLGLIHLKKVERTRQKITTYLGVDAPTLDDALDRWRKSAGQRGSGEAISSEAPLEDLPMDPPWDADLEHDPIEVLRWNHVERFELNLLDLGAEVSSEGFDF